MFSLLQYRLSIKIDLHKKMFFLSLSQDKTILGIIQHQNTNVITTLELFINTGSAGLPPLIKW